MLPHSLQSPRSLRWRALGNADFVGMKQGGEDGRHPAPMVGGELQTKAIRLKGKRLALNYSTSAAGSVRVELQDPAGDPLPGYALADCAELYGDTVERTVAWTGGIDVSSLAGQVLRLRFELKDAELFSFQFKE